MLRVGVSRQQYQRLELKGNPRLDTLELIAKGLNSELMLIPKEQLNAVQAVLEREPSATNEQPSAMKEKPSGVNEGTAQKSTRQLQDGAKKSLSDDPWQDLLGDGS